MRGSSLVALARSAGSARRALSTLKPALSRAPSLSSSDPSARRAKSAETAVHDILYGFPQQREVAKKRHILSVLVDNEPGVLSKVSGLLSARGFNIESLSVSATDVSDLSRMTIVLQCPDAQMGQAQRQLEDLVNVWAVLELKPDEAVEREMLLCKIDCVPATERASAIAGTHPSLEDLVARHKQRQAAVDIAKMFDGKVSNVGTEHIILEAVAQPRKIDAMLSLLRPLGIIEAVRSGALAMSQSQVTGIYDDNVRSEKAAVDDADLPPG
jgi:acetolactate synthase-1/3 small subunit